MFLENEKQCASLLFTFLFNVLTIFIVNQTWRVIMILFRFAGLFADFFFLSHESSDKNDYFAVLLGKYIYMKNKYGSFFLGLQKC